MRRAARFRFLQKAYYYDSILINHFDLKKNEKQLLTNVKVIRDYKELLENSVNFLNNFESFAAVCCGCTDPKNKVQLKRSIWFSSIGLEMKDFLNCYNKENEELKDAKLNILKEMIKMQCPIILKDRNTVLIESEISPKKIISSSKRMRHFFNVSEIYTCRSCFQKNKCKRFLQKYTGDPDFSDFTRVLIGFYNICKMYIKRSEADKKELVPFVEKVQYFHFALFHVYNYLLKHKAFNYTNVEEGNRNLILKYLKEKRRNMILIKNQLLQEKIMNIPKDYSSTMVPTEKAKMKRKQKDIFQKIQKLRRRERIPEEEEKFIWVEENEDDFYENEDLNNSLEVQGTGDSDNRENQIPISSTFFSDETEKCENYNMVEIKSPNDKLPCLRFDYVSKNMKEVTKMKSVNYSKLYNIYARKLQEKVYVNLDDLKVQEEEIAQCEDTLFSIPQQIGGYKFINFIENSPNNSIFPINENLYEGVQVYQKETINIDALWKDVENEQLNIKRIGFFDPFNIKNNYDMMKHMRRDADKQIDDMNEITELNEDLASFEESLYMKRNENVKNLKKKTIDHVTSGYNVYKPEDDEDERFEHFKKLKNENLLYEQHFKLKEEMGMRNIYDSFYNGEKQEKSYKHTFSIRRGLNDNQMDSNTIPMKEIEEEKKKLIENDKKELKDSSYFICKNVKFPSLSEQPNMESNSRSSNRESDKKRNRKKRK